MNKPENKYKKYADNKIKFNTTTLNDNKSYLSSSTSHNDEKDNEMFSDNIISSTFNVKAKLHNTLIGFNMKRKKTFFAKNEGKDINPRFCIDKSVESFSFSKFGQNNMKLKTVQKLEDIRNRYILNINDIKFDETLDVSNYVKTYDKLEIETLENYTYISTDSMSNQLNNSNSESKQIYNNLIVCIILLLLLTIINFGFIQIYQLIDNNINSYLHNCIFPVVLQIIIFNFVINYFIAFSISAFIFKNYGHQKTKCINRVIFKLFIEKYIKYIYGIRLLINKYYKELKFIDK